MIDILVTVPDCDSARMEALQRLIPVGLTGVRVIAKSRPTSETVRMLQILDRLRTRTGWPQIIWLDLPGARPRLSGLRPGLTELTTASRVTASDGSAAADIYVSDPVFWEALAGHGDFSIADNTVRLRVVSTSARRATCEVVRGGTVKPGRSIAVSGYPAGRFAISPADEDLVREVSLGTATTVVLSWVSSTDQLQDAREKLGPVALVPKLEEHIETEMLEAILGATSAILIGRADLYAGLGPERMRQTVHEYVKAARRRGVAAYVGSLIFDSLENNTSPSPEDASDVSALLGAGVRTFLLSGSGELTALKRKVANLSALASTLDG